MKVAVIIDHPYTLKSHDNIPHQRSFTAALAHNVIQGLKAAGHHVDVIDLHADAFDPVMNAEDLAAWRQGKTIDPKAQDYQQRVADAEQLIFVFPIWWELMPAMTKGFIDKVFAKGVLYTQTKSSFKPFANKLPNLKQVTVLTTTGTPTWLYRTWFGSPVIKALFRGTFMKLGIRKLRWKNYSSVDTWSLEERQKALSALQDEFRNQKLA